MKSGICPKCGSRKIMEGLRVSDNNPSSYAALGQFRTLMLEKVGPWNAKPLTATVCGDCGFTELYALKVEGLWEAHQKAKR